MNKIKEQRILEKQLGRVPRSIVDIPVLCGEKFPQVLVTAPLLEGSDNLFPTTFWLSCPELNYRIAKLEEQGLVTKIKEKIDQDEQLSERLKEAHQNYADYRVSLINEKDLKALKEKSEGQYEVIKKSGVGGIMDFAGIKCLHTHYAHYLVDQINPIGELVDNLLRDNFSKLNPKECKDKCEVEG